MVVPLSNIRTIIKESAVACIMRNCESFTPSSRFTAPLTLFWCLAIDPFTQGVNMAQFVWTIATLILVPCPSWKIYQWNRVKLSKVNFSSTLMVDYFVYLRCEAWAEATRRMTLKANRCMMAYADDGC